MDRSTIDIATLLRQLPIFSELDDRALRQLADRCVSPSFGAGRVLFASGDACRGLYVIETGRVRIFGMVKHVSVCGAIKA